MEHGHGAQVASGVFGDSFTPDVRERVDLEDGATRMSRGLRPTWRLVAVCAALGLATVVVMDVMSARQVRSRAFAAVQSADARHARRFIRCALPGVDVGQATTPARVRSTIEHTSQRLGAATAPRIGACLPELAALEAEVQRVRVLDDARPELAALQAATARLFTAWDRYQAFVASAPADDVNALPYVDSAAVAWTWYAQRRDALFEALRPTRGR